jgi:hypothetical protein
MNYCGPMLLGLLARVTSHPEEREMALEEAEGLLAEGCVSHSHFEFYHHAIEVSLREGDWAAAHRYADALAEYTRAEPLPWTELIIRRGRTLADIGAGRITPDTTRSLQELEATCRRLDVNLELPAIDEALAKVAAPQV